MSAPVRIRRRSEGLVWRELDDEVVILDLHASLYLTLNATGCLLWRSLERPTTATELAMCLADAFGLPSAEAVADVEAFLTNLENHDLIEASDERD